MARDRSGRVRSPAAAGLLIGLLAAALPSPSRAQDQTLPQVVAAADRGDSGVVARALRDSALLSAIGAAGKTTDFFLAVGRAPALSVEVRLAGYASALEELRRMDGLPDDHVAGAQALTQARQVSVEYVSLLDEAIRTVIVTLPPPSPQTTLERPLAVLEARLQDRELALSRLSTYLPACADAPAAAACPAVDAENRRLGDHAAIEAYGAFVRAAEDALREEARAYGMYNSEKKSGYRTYTAAANAFRSAAAYYGEAGEALRRISSAYAASADRMAQYRTRAIVRAGYADRVAAQRGPDNAPPPPPPPPPPPAPAPPPPPAAPPIINPSLAELALREPTASQALSSYQAQCRAGRPMPVSADMPLMFGTTRKPLPADRWNNLKEAFFGAEREAVVGGRLKTNYGKATVSVPCVRNRGEVNRPMLIELRQHDPAKDFILKPPTLSPDRQAWVAELAGRVRNSRNHEVLVYIHGFNNTFADAAYRAAQLEADLGVDGATVFYSWASRESLFRYEADRRTTESPEEAEALSDLLSAVRDAGAQHVYLIAHSMGNRLLLSTLERVASSNDGPIARFEQVVLASADIERTAFASEWPEAQRAVGHATLYASSKDKAMLVAKLFTDTRIERIGDATGVPTVATGLETIDTSDVAEGFIGHDDFSQAGLVDLRALFWLKASPRLRCILQESRTPQGGAYWRLLGPPRSRCTDSSFSDALELVRLAGCPQGALAWINRLLVPPGDPAVDPADAYVAAVKQILQDLVSPGG